MQPQMPMLTLLLLALGRECFARKWYDLADPRIYMAAALDPGRIEYSLERDPFNFAESPTFSPTLEPQESAVGPTASPTIMPTEVMSLPPTGQPTARYMFKVGNGRCATGTTLFEVRMEDSWGDGWGEIRMNITEVSQTQGGEQGGNYTGDLLVLEGEETVTVSQSVQKSYSAASSKTVFSDSLSHGDQAYKYLCLDLKKCYSVQVGAGLWEDEVKWEIRQAELGVPKEEWYDGLAAAKGLAPSNCQFSVPDQSTKEWPCPVTCGEPTATSTLSPSESPSFLPSSLGPDSSTFASNVPTS